MLDFETANSVDPYQGDLDLTLKKDANASIFYFSGDDTHIKGVVRPFPCLGPDGNFLPWRFPEGFVDETGVDRSGRITPWIWCTSYLFTRIGDPPVTFIAVDQEEAIRDPEAFARTPVGVLYRAIRAATRAGGKISTEFAGYRGTTDVSGYLEYKPREKRAMLGKPRKVYWVQGVIMEARDRPLKPPFGLSPEQPLAVAQLGEMLGRALEAKLTERDPQGNYVCGDVVDLKHGKFLVAYDRQYGEPRMLGAASEGRWETAMQGQAELPGDQRQRRKGMRQYDVKFVDQYGSYSASLESAADVIRSKVRPWTDLFYAPSIEEQVDLLATRFPADVLLYAWQNHPEWLQHPAITGRVTASVPASVPQPPTSAPLATPQQQQPQPLQADQTVSQPVAEGLDAAAVAQPAVPTQSTSQQPVGQPQPPSQPSPSPQQAPVSPVTPQVPQTAGTGWDDALTAPAPAPQQPQSGQPAQQQPAAGQGPVVDAPWGQVQAQPESQQGGAPGVVDEKAQAFLQRIRQQAQNFQGQQGQG